jgi:hypothetical protein
MVEGVRKEGSGHANRKSIPGEEKTSFMANNQIRLYDRNRLSILR